MARQVTKNSKRKHGMRAAYYPALLPEPTDDAKIPVWQQDGSVKYVSQKDFEWLLNNVTDGLTSTYQASQK